MLEAKAGNKILPLQGIRILDLSQNLAGPFGSMLMGDLGAEIIKVEPREGDFIRQLPPISRGVKVPILRRSTATKKV